MVGEEIEAIPLVGAVPDKLFSGIFVKRKAKAKVLVVLNPESCVEVVGIAEIPRTEGAVCQRVRRTKPSSSFPDPTLPKHEIGILLAQQASAQRQVGLLLAVLDKYKRQ